MVFHYQNVFFSLFVEENNGFIIDVQGANKEVNNKINI